MSALSVIDYLVFGAVLFCSTLIGLYYAWKGRKSQSKEQTQEYLTGGRNMSVFPVSLSLVASIISSHFVLGMPSEIYTHSTQFWMSTLGSVVGIAVCNGIFLPMFYELQLTSVNKYLLKRFDLPALRILGSVFFIISGVFSSGTMIYGPALAISSVTSMSIDASIWSVGIVCTFYTVIGGLKAVIWTDVFQIFIMVAGMLIVAIQGTITVGGWTNVWEISSKGNLLQWTNMYIDPVYGVPTLWEVFFGLLIFWAGMFSTNQMCVQRYCALPTLLKAKLSMYISLPFVCVFMSLSCFCGVVIYANYYNCDPIMTNKIFSPDQLMPYYVLENLSHVPGLAGLFVAAVFSGSLSSLSSNINSMTVVTWDDFLKKCVKVSALTEGILIKIIGLVYGALTIAMAFLSKRMGSVLEVVILFRGGLVGPMFGTFILGATVPFVDGQSAMISFILGQAVCISVNLMIAVLGRPKRRLPTSIDGCLSTNHTSPMLFSQEFNETGTEAYPSSTFNPHHHDTYWIQNMSPFFLPFVGMIITIFSGLLLSLLRKRKGQAPVNPRFISPAFRRFIRRGDIKEENNILNLSLMQQKSVEEKNDIELKYRIL